MLKSTRESKVLSECNEIKPISQVDITEGNNEIDLIPQNWFPNTKDPKHKKTRSSLLQQRKQENIPDKSYDIDGDGFVGSYDYLFARLFDKDCKGYLTAEEKSECLKKVADKEFTDKFLFGLDTQTGAGDTKDFAALKIRVQ